MRSNKVPLECDLRAATTSRFRVGEASFSAHVSASDLVDHDHLQVGELKLNSLLMVSLISGSWMLVGRLTGFGRDYVIASEFGLTELSDALVAILVFPELIPQIFLASSVAVSLIKLLPITQQASRLFSNVISLFSLPYILITGLLLTFPISILALVGGDEYLVSSLGTYDLLLIAFITFISYLSIVISGGVNAYSCFGFSQSSVAVLNVLLIYSIFVGDGSIQSFLYGLLAAHVGRFIWIMLEPRARLLFEFPRLMDTAELTTILRVLYVAFSVSAVMLGLHLVCRFLSSDQISGFASQIHYQLRASDMLVGILSAFISVVWLPRLAACSRPESAKFFRLFTQGLRQTFICVLLGLYCLDPALNFLWGLYFKEGFDQAAMQNGNGAIICLFSVGAFCSLLGCVWVVRNDWKSPVVTLLCALGFIAIITTVSGTRDIVSVAAVSLVISLMILTVRYGKFSMVIIRRAFFSDLMVLTSVVSVVALLGIERLFLQPDHQGNLVIMRVMSAVLIVSALTYYYIYRGVRASKL